MWDCLLFIATEPRNCETLEDSRGRCTPRNQTRVRVDFHRKAFYCLVCILPERSVERAIVRRYDPSIRTASEISISIARRFEARKRKALSFCTPFCGIPHGKMPARELLERAIRMHAAGRTENAILAILIPCKEPTLLITARECSRVNRPTTREIAR